MMNIIQLQDNLKNLSDQQLTQAMQMPAQDTPPFLVVSELNRRKKMRDSFQAQQADQNKTTVAQDVVAAAGVPQGPASQMAQSLAPKTDMTNNTGIMSIPQGGEPQRMAGGGRVTKMYEGKLITGPDGRIFFPSAIVGGAYYDPTTESFLGGDGTPLPAEALPGVSNEYYQIVKDASNQSQAATTQADIDLGLTPNVDFIEAQKKLKAAQEAQAAAQLRISQTNNPNPDPLYSHAAGAEAQGPYGSGIPPGTPPSVAPGTPIDLAQLAAMTTDKKDTSTSGGGGGGGSSKPSDYEQALMDALANADKKAKQDKWMALAQMGLSMMSSQQPNFLASVGEAGTNAIPAFQKARDTADDTKLGLNKGLYDIAQQRQARNDALAAAAAKADAKSSGGFGISADAGRYIDKVKASVDVAAQNLTNLGYQPGMDPADPSLTPARQMEIKTALNAYNTALNRYNTLNNLLTSGLGDSGGVSTDPTAQQDFAD